MNLRIYSTLVLDKLYQYPNCLGILRKKVSKFFVEQQSSNIVTLASGPRALHSDICKPYIHHSKAGLKVKTMEQFSSESGTENVATIPQSKDIHVRTVRKENGWLNIGDYSIFAWSVSGVESCIVVKSEDMQVVFDMGVALRESVKVPNVFITHGHIDHVGAVASHIAKRSLFGMKPARYFTPSHLIDPIKAVVNSFQEMAETGQSADGVNILPMTEKEPVYLNSRFFVKTFPTIHRVPSQGYIIYKEERVLKDEYRGMEGFEVSALHRAGKDIHHVVITPEIAYTGDTTIEVFINPPTPDLLKVKTLITEATFLEEHDKKGNSMVDKAKARGHIHLMELAQNEHLFDEVGHLVLVHFSSKYSPKFICDSIRDKLPFTLRNKVTPGTVAASTSTHSY